MTEQYRRSSCEQAGYSVEALQRLEKHFAELIRLDKIQSASYLLSRDGNVFAAGADGQLHYDRPDSRMEVDSIRRIASVTKMFTAVAIFQLIEQGKLFLRQPVADWIEPFKHPLFEKISLLHLLTHTSGLQADPNYFLEPYPSGWWDIDFAYEPETEGPRAVTNPQELEGQRRSVWIKALLSGKPLAEPGEQWMYSSAGFAVLGEIVERASGMSYEAYVMRHIVDPLGMKRTFFAVPDALKQETCIINEHEASRLKRDDEERIYSPPRAGGGMYSTPQDLFRFGQMLLNGGALDGVRVLSRKAVEKMSSNILNKGIDAYNWGGRQKDIAYGIGPLLIGKGEWLPEGVYGHEGAGRCKLLLDKERNAVMLFFVPSNTDWCPESMYGTQNMIGAGWL